jgi:dihydroorotate dehydrogenase (fumarate)
MGSVVARNNSSLNSLGYSPVPLQGYLDMVKTIARETPSPKRKWFIISVTGTPDDVAASYGLILEAQRGLDLLSFPLAMEVNLSCPNIPGAPPPAYYGPALTEYISAVVAAVKRYDDLHGLRVPVGLKTPPYTHAGEYDTLVEALSNSIESGGLCISFLTATNTLGSCLIDDNEGKVLPGDGLGGMAGSALHPLALGNVKTLRTRLDQQPRGLGHIQVIGVGGVDDWYGYCRMRAAGASAVGIGTALGMYGLDVFKGIEEIAAGKWDIMDR